MAEISIIVPVYKVEDKLQRCVDSLLSQSFTDFELLLIDDGSSDCSGGICDKYSAADERVRVIHQPNSGVSTARNVGIDYSTGKRIVFADSDDYVETDYLKVLYDGYQSGAELSICGVAFGNDKNNNLTAQNNTGDYYLSLSPVNTDRINTLIDERRFNYVYAKMFCTDIIKKNKIRFVTDLSLGEDTVFVMDYVRYADSCFLAGAAYYNYIRASSGSLTSVFYPDLFDKYIYINGKIYSTFREKSIDVTPAVNNRLLYSALWTINAIRFKSDYEEEKKLSLIAEVINSSELISAIETDCAVVQNNPEFAVMLSHSSKKLLKYYQMREIKEEIFLGIKKAVVFFFPHEFIQKVKKCLQIAA